MKEKTNQNATTRVDEALQIKKQLAKILQVCHCSMYAKILEILEETGKKKKQAKNSKCYVPSPTRDTCIPILWCNVHVLFFQFLRCPRYMYFKHA